MIKSFRDLQIYEDSFDLMVRIHDLVKQFPIYERKDLADQMRRASKSIPANIAEGWSKRTYEKDFKRHLDVALGSANEMEVHIETAKSLHYLEAAICDELLIRYNHLGGKIENLRKIWRTF